MLEIYFEKKNQINIASSLSAKRLSMYMIMIFEYFPTPKSTDFDDSITE